MRLIDADALREQIVEVRKDAGFYSPIYAGFLSVIDRSPAIEAEPVKHGKWLNAVEEDPELYGWVRLDTVLCSVCRKLDKENNRKTPYCPHCGAKMDLE